MRPAPLGEAHFPPWPRGACMLEARVDALDVLMAARGAREASRSARAPLARALARLGRVAASGVRWRMTEPVVWIRNMRARGCGQLADVVLLGAAFPSKLARAARLRSARSAAVGRAASEGSGRAFAGERVPHP